MLRVPVLLIALATLDAGSRVASESEVRFDHGLPAYEASGKRIVAAGSFSVEAGYSLVELKLWAGPIKGGRAGQQVCTVEGGGTIWSGRIDASELPGGVDYTVYAFITVVDADGELHHYTSRSVNVRIP